MGLQDRATGLDAAKLLSDRENALLASVQVGTYPHGLNYFDLNVNNNH